MQVSIETTEGLERRLTVGVPADRIESEINARLQKALPNVRIDGFRPGKVPMRVAKQRFGAGVRQEVLGEIMSQTFFEAVEQESLKPAGQPSIEPKTIQEGRDFQYVATFEVYPEFDLADIAGKSVTKSVAEVEDGDVDDMVATLRKQHGEWLPVDEAAVEGDQLRLDYIGRRDGEPFDGGSAEDSKLLLGSGNMIKGFEEGLIGSKAEDTRTLSLRFPEDYHAEELRDAAVEFEVKVHEVARLELAELNEEFFGKLGVKEGGETEFRAELRQNMERELNNALRSKLKADVLEVLLDANEIQIPKVLVAQEIESTRQQTLQQFGGDASQFDVSLLPDELFEEQSQRRVKLGLLLGELIRQRDLKADPDTVKEMVEEMASAYENPEEVVNWYYANEQQLANVEAAALEQHAVDTLLEELSIDERQESYKDVVQASAPG